MTHDGNARNVAASLKMTFGSFVELNGDGSRPAEAFRILAELELDGRRYAVLQSEAMRKEGDIEVFRIAGGGGEGPELETVEDDDEWERVAEAYDDLQFGSDEMP